MKATKQRFQFTIDAKSLKEGDKTNKVMVDVWHSDGGQCLGGTNEARSIWCSVTPIEQQACGVQIHMLTHGMRYQLEFVKRRSDKKMAAWLEVARKEVDAKAGKTWDVIQAVLKREQIQLL